MSTVINIEPRIQVIEEMIIAIAEVRRRFDR